MKRFRIVLEVLCEDHTKPEEVVEMFEDFAEDWYDMDVDMVDIAATEIDHNDDV